MMGLRVVSVAVAITVWLVAPAKAQEGDRIGEGQMPRIPKENIPPAPPLDPGKALKQFKLPPGFAIELVACEPMVENPVVLQFDPDGRLWVLEMRGYMPNADGLGEETPVGRLSILEDTDGDGRMDAKQVFLDGLVLPRAFLLVKGGVLVCEPPQLWFYPDAEGRGRGPAGQRTLVAADFAKEADPSLGKRMNVEQSGNSLLRNIDNWIYSLDHPYRYQFRGGKWQREPTPKRVQWGLSQDDFGRLYYSANSDHLRGDLVPSHYFASQPGGSKLPGIGVQLAKDQAVWPIRVNPGVNRGYEPDTLRSDGTLSRFTAACGACIYRGDLFPPEYHGNAFVCEPAANLVRRCSLSEQDGVITARNAYDQAEFLASADELFRPVNLAVGPDGGLYVADMYHGIIQHRLFLTSYLRAQAKDRGLDKVTHNGRIWRVLPAGSRRPLKPNLSRATSHALVQALSLPNGWWRDTAQRLLVERADASVVPALQQLLSSDLNPVARFHVLWSLEGIGQLTIPVIQAALSDAAPKVRALALRLAEAPLMHPTNNPAIDALREQVLDRASDPSVDVQLQLALSLSLIPPDEKVRQILAQLSGSSSAGIVRDAASFAITARAPVKAKPSTVASARPLTEEEKRRFEAGKTMYEATCLACHQQHGMGQAGLAPPLVGSEWVAGSEGRLIRIVLNGLRGPIRVKGDTFELDMPALGILDDDQIAAALTFVRREWGHTYEPVTPDGVKKVREETAKREDAWTMSDLMAIP
jgi:glucose/arabinose dehydrogenase/mono/diheme cytochrome c family protein